MPSHLTATLVDVDGGRWRYLGTTRSYAFTLQGSASRRFQLVVEPRAGGATRLSNIAVVQTRGGLTVQYALNTPATVHARIRSAPGRTVETMQASRAASIGRNTLTWQGRGERAGLPKGMYVVERAARTEAGQAAKAVRTVAIH